MHQGSLDRKDCGGNRLTVQVDAQFIVAVELKAQVVQGEYGIMDAGRPQVYPRIGHVQEGLLGTGGQQPDAEAGPFTRLAGQPEGDRRLGVDGGKPGRQNPVEQTDEAGLAVLVEKGVITDVAPLESGHINFVLLPRISTASIIEILGIRSITFFKHEGNFLAAVLLLALALPLLGLLTLTAQWEDQSGTVANLPLR